MPRLGENPLRRTTRAEWVALIAAKARDAPATGAHLYRVASAFLNHAEAAGWIDAPVLPRKGAATLAPPPPSRERVLTDDELRRVWRAAETLGPKARAFVRLLILTACRRSEVAGLRLGEVDREAALWVVPAARAKNRTAHTVPLSPLALEALAKVWLENAADLAPDHALLGHVRGSPL